MSNRPEIFNWLEENSQNIITLELPKEALEKSIDEVGAAYTFHSDEKSFAKMKDGFKNLLLSTTHIQFTYGTVARASSVEDKTPSLKVITDNFVGERDYQDNQIRAKYGSEGKEFTATQELTMCRSYYTNFIKTTDDTTKFVDNTRKIGAMALRWLEGNWDREYTPGLVL